MAEADRALMAQTVVERRLKQREAAERLGPEGSSGQRENRTDDVLQKADRSICYRHTTRT